MQRSRLLRLASLLLLAVSTNASAYDAPMEFQGLDAAKAWFAKSYPEYGMRKESVANGGKDVGDIYGFYGPRGSGIGRVEAWYYGCDRISCSLFAMIKYRALRSKEEEPKLSFESGSLVISIRQRRNSQARTVVGPRRFQAGVTSATAGRPSSSTGSALNNSTGGTFSIADRAGP